MGMSQEKKLCDDIRCISFQRCYLELVGEEGIRKSRYERLRQLAEKCPYWRGRLDPEPEAKLNVSDSGPNGLVSWITKRQGDANKELRSYASTLLPGNRISQLLFIGGVVIRDKFPMDLSPLSEQQLVEKIQQLDNLESSIPTLTLSHYQLDLLTRAYAQTIRGWNSHKCNMNLEATFFNLVFENVITKLT